jgi:hypothetical protein
MSLIDPWGAQQNVRRPDRWEDPLWRAGAYILPYDNQYQWAVCIFEWAYYPVGKRAFLKSIGAWCLDAAHATGWGRQNCLPASDCFWAVKRAPFWSKIRQWEWRPDGQ